MPDVPSESGERQSWEGAPPGTVVREEELRVETKPRATGAIRFVKEPESRSGIAYVPLASEEALVEHQDAHSEDSGEVETLSDGSISIPVLEEELVVMRRVVVRERIIVRKRTAIEERSVEAELRRERVSIEADEGVEVVPPEVAGDPPREPG